MGNIAEELRRISSNGLPRDEKEDLEFIAQNLFKGKNETWKDFAFAKTLANLQLVAISGRNMTTLSAMQIFGGEQREGFSMAKDFTLNKLRQSGLFVQDGDFDEVMCQGIVGVYVSWE